MTIQQSPGRSLGNKWGATGFGVVLALGGLTMAGTGPDTSDTIAKGREIFVREWVPGEPTRHGGDGLGPVYNDTSCVACHNLNGPGGAGPSNKNAEILTAISNSQSGLAGLTIALHKPVAVVQKGESRFLVVRDATDGRKLNSSTTPTKSASPPESVTFVELDVETRTEPAARTEDVVLFSNISTRPSQPHKPSIEELAQLHPAFRSARSISLHLFSTDPRYQAWRSKILGTNEPAAQVVSAGTRVTAQDRMKLDLMTIRNRLANRSPRNLPQAQHGDFNVELSRRNAPALFGAGLIDAIPDSVIEEAARAKCPQFPEIQGRASRLPDGSIGRFGWKGQTASLKEFVLTACAVELGLEVPGHSQGKLPYAPADHARKPGLDLDSAECDALVAFVRNLPPPSQRRPSSEREAARIRAGKKRFEAAGCATCHTPKLGSVDRLYSDLLLHDMGPELADNGVYGNGSADPNSDAPAAVNSVAGAAAGGAAAGAAVRAPRGATRQEWRTPPLWGFRDTAPYLHDGRAATLEEAVALHGGQATRSAQRFFQLAPQERLAIETFLKSLTAPVATQ